MQGRWSGIEAAQQDPITGLAAALKNDPHKEKVGLCQGKYLDEQGKPYLLQAVREAEKLLALEPADHEYPMVEGIAEFIQLARDFAFGDDCAAVRDGCVSSVQTLSGSGALRVAAESLMHVSGHADKTIWISNPSWGNHAHIFKSVGLEVQYYRYIDDKGTTLDFDGMKEDLATTMPAGSVVLLQSSAHNPTGIDPTPAQWDELARVCLERQLVPLLDTAYQGFASGDTEADAYCVRKMVSLGCRPLVAQSFAKNMGLYGERVGCLSIVCSSADEATRLTSQIKQRVLRTLWSFPPVYGARIATRILKTPALKSLWYEDMRIMSGRIGAMRRQLYDALIANNTPSPTGSWEHIISQIGMFAYTGLSADHVASLLQEHHIYLTPDGRMAICGLRSVTVPLVAKAIDSVLRADPKLQKP